MSNGKNSLSIHNTLLIAIQKPNPKLFERLIVYHSETVENRPQISAQIFYPDGTSKSIPGIRFKKVRTEEPGFYKSNQWAHYAQIPKYEKGMLIRLITHRHYFRPEFKNQYPVRGNLPTLSKKVVLKIPKGTQLTSGLSNPEGLEVDSSRTTRLVEEITYAFKNVEKISSENQMKHPEDWYASVYFNVPPVGHKSFSWTELGDYYLNTIKKSIVSHPKITSLAKSIQSTNPGEIVHEAFSILRERIRYHADEKDIYAIVPRPPGTILTQGYGDCKEMSTLLMVLLREKGVHSGLALTVSEGNFQLREEYPGLNNFNHIILYLKDSEGNLRYLDPTVKFGNSHNSYLGVNGQRALFLKPGGSRPGVIRSDSNFVNQIITRSQVSESSGRWLLKGSIELHGLAAFNLQRVLQNQNKEEAGGFLKQYLAEVFNLNCLSHKMETKTSSAITISYTANFTNSYLKLGEGGLLLNAPSLFGGLTKFTTLEREGPRYFEQLEQTDSWVLPPGFSELEKHEIDHKIAKGSWVQSDQAVTRKHQTRRVRIGNSERSELKRYFSSRSKFLKTAIWRP